MMEQPVTIPDVDFGETDTHHPSHRSPKESREWRKGQP